MRPEDVDLEAGQLISFASSRRADEGRWTELAVYHFAEPPQRGRNWMSVKRHFTCPAEPPRESRLLVGSLDRALKLFDEGVDLGIIAAEQARDWADRQLPAALLTAIGSRLGVTYEEMAEDYRAMYRTAPTFDTDAQALAWLYDMPADRLPSVNSMAADLGIGESTLRMALKNGTGVKVPLATVAALIDRALFQHRRELRGNKQLIASMSEGYLA